MFQHGDSDLLADGASSAMLIVRGLMKVSVTSDADRQTLLWIRGPGDLLGEQSALRELLASPARLPVSGLLSGATVTALGNVRVRAIPAADLARFLQLRPEILAAIALDLCERLAEAESRIASIGRDNADRRLARLLCELERYGSPVGPPRPVGLPGPTWPSGTAMPQPTGTEIPIRLSHGELASWVDTGRRTVERALERWRARGIVSTRYRTIVVRDLATLARIAGVEVRRQAWNWPGPASSPSDLDIPEQPRRAARSAARRTALTSPSAGARRPLGVGLGALIPAAPPDRRL